MSQTGNYIKVDDILFKAAGFAGDKDYSRVPYGFYVQLISDAFEELNMDAKMLDGHADFSMSTFTDHLTIPLPKDCFDVKNVWMYDGDVCDIGRSRKVWPKRNYYTQGVGYLANRTGFNTNDPYYLNDSLTNNRLAEDKSLIRYNDNRNINRLLFYNIQNGNLMLSASCRNAGAKCHINYNSTGCEVGEAPIIPRFFKGAIEDYTTEAAMRFRMANEPASARNWQVLQQMYERRLDKEGMNGSWHKAVQQYKNMSTAEREGLTTYLGRGAWATGR